MSVACSGCGETIDKCEVCKEEFGDDEEIYCFEIDCRPLPLLQPSWKNFHICKTDTCFKSYVEKILNISDERTYKEE